MTMAQQLSIILVEDEPAHIEAIRRAFVNSVPAPVIRGAATLAAFKEEAVLRVPDIAIMDLNLADGTAVDFLVASADSLPFPVLIMTSHGSEEAAVEAMKAGAQDYVVKSPDVFATLPRITARVIQAWQDQTERKKMVDELRESEHQYRTLASQFNELLDAIPDDITIIATDFKILWANNRAAHNLGKEVSDLLGHACHNLWYGRDTPCSFCPVERTMTTGLTVRETILTPQKKTLEKRSIPLSEGGRIVKLIVISRDITEQVETESQLRQAMKMEAVGRLAGGVAHDFNNMLGVILGYIDMALERVAGDNPLYQDLRHIQMAAKRSADLTRQLLTFSRKEIVMPRVVNLGEVAQDHRKMLARMIGEDITIEITAAEGLWHVRIDPAQVGQILANLAVNARDAIAGTGRFSITLTNVVIERALSSLDMTIAPGRYVKLTVRDTGHGMDNQTLTHIFEPFFTTKEPGKGTGLGLAMVYGIVKQNGGIITAESATGQGTSFEILLPREAAGAEMNSDDQETAAIGGSGTILVVEDEKQILDMVVTMLNRLGYTALSATGPGDASLIAETYEGPIDLLLTDVVMPRMDGRELQQRIQALRPDIRTLFMSGHATEVLAGHGISTDQFNYVQKPFTKTRIAVAISNVLNRQEP